MFSDEDSDPFSREGAERSVVCNNIVIPPSPTIIIRETPPETAVQRKNEVLFSDEEDIFDHVKNRPRAMKRRSNTAYDSFDDSFEQQNEPRPPKRKPSPDVVSDSFDDSFEQKTEPKPPGRKISLNDSFDDEVELVTNPAEQVKDGPAVGQPSTEEAPLCDSFDASFDRPVEFMPAPVQDDSFDDSCGNLVAAAVEEDIFDRGVVQNAEGDALHLITLRSDTEIRVSFDGSDAIRTPRAARANSFDGSDENRIAETMRKDSFDADDESLARSVPVQRHSIQRVAEEYSSIEKAMEVLDELTQQLKLAVSLQRDAETSRNSGFNLFPCALEGRHLSSGSHLLLLKIENKSQHDLRGWQLSISSGSADKTTHVGKSRSLDLGHVPVGGKKHLEVLTSSQAYEPSLYEMELYRIFDIDGHGSAFRIPLGWTLFSSLNQLSPRQDDEMLDNRRFNSTFCVPIGLVRLLCDGNLDEYAFLTHLLKPSNIEVLSQPITLSVSQESRNFVLKISVKDPLIRQTLKRDLQLYITLSVSQLRDCPQLNQIVLDFSTIDQLYESVVSSF